MTGSLGRWSSQGLLFIFHSMTYLLVDVLFLRKKKCCTCLFMVDSVLSNDSWNWPVRFFFKCIVCVFRKERHMGRGKGWSFLFRASCPNRAPARAEVSKRSVCLTPPPCGNTSYWLVPQRTSQSFAAYLSNSWTKFVYNILFYFLAEFQPFWPCLVGFILPRIQARRILLRYCLFPQCDHCI